MKRLSLLAAAVAGVCLAASTSSAARLLQDTRPAPPPAVNGDELRAVVVDVNGIVQVRSSEDAEWVPARRGMVLPVGGECRTGPRSTIQLRIGREQVVTLDRLGTVKILEALRAGGRLKTDLGMQYGRVQYSIEAAGIEHDAVIRSPSSVLAVRGTNVVKTDEPFTSRVVLLKGQVRSPNKHDNTITMGSGPRSNYGDNYVELDTQLDVSPPEHELKQAATPWIDLPVIALNEHPVYYFDNSANFSATGVRVEDFQFRGLMTSGQVISRPPVIPPVRPGESVPGTLNISLQWISDQATGPNLPNLDLFVLTPRGERIFPLDKPFTTPSGGRVSANDRGGQQATLGFESVNWTRRYPVGEYKYGVRYRGEGDPANYRITIFQNGRQINAEFDDVVTQFDRRATFEIDVNPEPPRGGKLKLAGGGNKDANSRTGRRK